MATKTPTTEQASMGRTLKGVIVSDKMSKTVIVEIIRLYKHKLYKKYRKTTMRYKAHDEVGQYHTGDTVLIHESRPLSKTKRWIVIGYADKPKIKSSSGS